MCFTNADKKSMINQQDRCHLLFEALTADLQYSVPVKGSAERRVLCKFIQPVVFGALRSEVLLGAAKIEGCSVSCSGSRLASRETQNSRDAVWGQWWLQPLSVSC